MQALGLEDVTVDIHCVTHWTKLDMAWRGVPLDKLFENVESEFDYVMAHSYGGYTTNVPLEDLLDGKSWIAFEADGEPLTPEHGGPARLLVPAPLLLEERQVGARADHDASGRPRFLGAVGLPPARRPVAGGALLVTRRRAGTRPPSPRCAPRPRARDASSSTCRPGRATTPARTSTSG